MKNKTETSNMADIDKAIEEIDQGSARDEGDEVVRSPVGRRHVI